MSKYYVPVEIDGKWELVECRYSPSLEVGLSNEASTRYPTLESDSAYWASKAGVKMGEGEFNLELVKSKVVDYLEYTAIPIQSPTTKELIEQEAERRYGSIECTNEYHKPECKCETLDSISAFKNGCTFALSLPKQDNGDAWDEAKKMALEEFDDWGIKYGRISRLIAFLKQHYSISKIK